MTTENQHAPPAHLNADTGHWWSTVMAEYSLEPHHIRLLTLACEAYDSATEASEVLRHEVKFSSIGLINQSHDQKWRYSVTAPSALLGCCENWTSMLPVQQIAHDRQL